jgi:arylformamidase
MNLVFEHGGQRYCGRLAEAKSIAIDLDFDGAQPNHFAAPLAKRTPLSSGEFVGRTSSGGSCNVDVIEMVPHCNGTHTETVSHIVDEKIVIGKAVLKPVMLAVLITVKPEVAEQVSDSYRPSLLDSDHVIVAADIDAASAEFVSAQPDALIVRTLPNTTDKRSRCYGDEVQPPFFSVEAIEAINRLGIQHLLVDIPSIDRMRDDGLLTNHHLFWNVAEGTHQLSADSHRKKTITEMLFVADEHADGLYGLSLQLPAFISDAAPSRPIIWPVSKLGD